MISSGFCAEPASSGRFQAWLIASKSWHCQCSDGQRRPKLNLDIWGKKSVPEAIQ
jgi:hypothetical protein